MSFDRRTCRSIVALFTCLGIVVLAVMREAAAAAFEATSEAAAAAAAADAAAWAAAARAAWAAAGAARNAARAARNAARAAAYDKSKDSDSPEWHQAYAAEVAWQIRRLVDVLSALQAGKKWPRMKATP